jgi:hypothetical protein
LIISKLPSPLKTSSGRCTSGAAADLEDLNGGLQTDPAVDSGFGGSRSGWPLQGFKLSLSSRGRLTAADPKATVKDFEAVVRLES